ncbi:MAG TPA: amidohydrolase family protein [Gammaproteobacteria bacterium]
MKQVKRWLVIVSLPLAIVALAMWKPDYQPPIFDAQVHYNENAWERVRVEAIANGIRELNVRWLLVGSTPNAGTWQLAAALPERVIPMWVPEVVREARDQWMDDPAQLREMEQALRQRPYRGVGELWLNRRDTAHPGVLRLLELARERGLLLHLRTDAGSIRDLFASEPQLRILWAHAGVYDKAEAVAEMLGRYPNLWIELSHRHDATPRGGLDPAWRQLILDHPERVLVGTGTYTADLWYQYRTILSDHRSWLEQLPEVVMQRVAYRNGMDLFGLVDPAE